MRLDEIAAFLCSLLILIAVIAAVTFAPRYCEVAGGVLLVLGATWAAGAAVRGQILDPVRWVRVAWLAAFLGATGVTLLGWGFVTAAILAVAFAGATILDFTAFILWLLLGDAHPVFRTLLIVLFCTGLVVEVVAIAGAFGFPTGLRFW
jgi:hypothetical protein